MMEFNQFHQGDALELARTLPDQSINCIVTSPPYWGLRDYGHDGQIGHEETPQVYVSRLVELFAELRRALKDDGTLWLNLGDSYAGNNGSNGEAESRNLKTDKFHGGQAHLEQRRTVGNAQLAPKQLIGIPWRVALALQDDGWYLRSDIIWAKPNPMPESVTDRPTKAHEYIFLLSKSAKYYYDHEAIKEPAKDWGKRDRKEGSAFVNGTPGRGKQSGGENCDFAETGRNKRSVWTIATTPYKNAHFAVFPPDLIEPCILAGCPSKVCPECGRPWRREIIKTDEPAASHKGSYFDRGKTGVNGNGRVQPGERSETKSGGFIPDCDCQADTRPGVVLDPFMGSGTVAQVAIKHHRQWIGFELNPDYIELAKKRIAAVQPVLGW